MSPMAIDQTKDSGNIRRNMDKIVSGAVEKGGAVVVESRAVVWGVFNVISGEML